MMPSALNSFTVVTVPNVTSVPNVTPTRNMPKITKKNSLVMCQNIASIRKCGHKVHSRIFRHMKEYPAAMRKATAIGGVLRNLFKVS